MEKSALHVLQKKPSQVHFYYILEEHWGNPSSEHQDAAAQPRAPACFAGGIAALQCRASCM